MHLFYKQTCCENLRSSMASCAQTYLAQRENSHLILPAAQGFKTEWLVVQQCMTKVENSHLVPPAAQSYETVASCAAIHNQREEVSPCSTCCSKLSNCGQLCSNTQPKRRSLTLFHLLLKVIKLWPAVQQYTTKAETSHLVPPAAQSSEEAWPVVHSYTWQKCRCGCPHHLPFPPLTGPAAPEISVIICILPTRKSAYQTTVVVFWSPIRKKSCWCM